MEKFFVLELTFAGFVTGFLCEKSITHEEFSDACNSNKPENIITFSKNYARHDDSLSIFDFIAYDNYHVIFNSCANNHIKTTLFLLLTLHATQEEDLHEKVDDVLHWAALKNDITSYTSSQKLLNLYHLCSQYKTFYNKLRSDTDDMWHAAYPTSFRYIFNNEVLPDNMLWMPNDKNTLCDYFIVACLAGHTGSAEYLSYVLKGRNKTFNVNDVTYEGESLLHHAARQNNPTIIRLLFQLNHAYQCKNKDGLTPLQVAKTENNTESIEALLKQEAYLQTQVDLMKSFTQKEEHFQEKNIIKHIMSYTTKDDFKPNAKPKEYMIGIM
jgi:ankyrin repeat protein